MRRFGTVLAGLLLVPALAFANDAAQSTSRPPQSIHSAEHKITLLSGDKAIATLILSRGEGSKVEYQAQSVQSSRSDTSRTTRLSGNVLLKVIRDGRQVLQLSADEAAIEEPRQQASQQTPSK